MVSLPTYQVMSKGLCQFNYWHILASHRMPIGYNRYISNSPPLPYMRLIEQQMNSAIRNKQNFSKSNTMVRYDKAENLSSVYLHGHRIADYCHTKGKAWISSCGWETNTTKSRLNAFLYEVAYGVSVFQKNWQWFLHDNRTTATIDFYDNMVVFSKPLTLSAL